jgi:hypothetical protein
VCVNPIALALTTVAGGYEARVAKYGLSASAGLIQTDGETATP